VKNIYLSVVNILIFSVSQLAEGVSDEFYGSVTHLFVVVVVCFIKDADRAVGQDDLNAVTEMDAHWNDYFLALGLSFIVTAQELRKNLNDESYTKQIDECFDEIRKYFLNYEYKAVMKVVSPEGELIDHYDGREVRLSAPRRKHISTSEVISGKARSIFRECILRRGGYVKIFCQNNSR
jgi:hypothetical protein